jgi:hypothetical protein
MVGNTSLLNTFVQALCHFGFCHRDPLSLVTTGYAIGLEAGMDTIVSGVLLGVGLLVGVWLFLGLMDWLSNLGQSPEATQRQHEKWMRETYPGWTPERSSDYWREQSQQRESKPVQRAPQPPPTSTSH